MFRTKLFLLLYFLPPFAAALLQWGDDRTSSGFAAAPIWYFQLQLLVQYGAMLMLFFPPQLRLRPSLATLFAAAVTIIALSFAQPIIEAEYILINGSRLIALIAIFLAIAQPSATIEKSDMVLLFWMFAAGFALQLLLYAQFGILPSHSITDVFIRFNGITNDSLSSAFLISLFVPWAVTSRWPLPAVLVILGEALASGSLFAVGFNFVAVFGLLVYHKRYRTLLAAVAAIAATAVIFYDVISRILDVKLLSILTHLRFFLDLSGTVYTKSGTSCSEEFCESLVESGLSLSPVYLFAFYGLLLCFLVPLFRRDRTEGLPPLMTQTLRLLGSALFVGSAVHPVPLIPYAMPLFLIFTSMHLGRQRGVAPVPRREPLPFARRRHPVMAQHLDA